MTTSAPVADAAMDVLDDVAGLAQRLVGASIVVVCARGGVVEAHARANVGLAPGAVACLCGDGADVLVVDDPAQRPDHPVAQLLDLGASSVVSVPITSESGEPFGSITCGWSRPGAASGKEDLRLLANLASSVVELWRVRTRAAEAEALALATTAQKQRVTSRLSHDLRTPMTAILGFGELLRMEELSENGTESVQHLLAAARKLLGMIDEILDLNRLDQGEQSAAVEDLALADVVNVARVAVSRDAEEQAVTVVLDDSCIGPHVASDRRRLQRVVMSLLGNAIDRSARGSTVTVSATSDGATVRLSIRTPSVDGQLPARAAGDPDGTRDGLTLSKRLMEAMDGDVGVEHRDGRTWWLEVPAIPPGGLVRDTPRAVEGTAGAASAAAGDAGGGADPSTTAQVLLYVEDDPANQQLVSRMFGRQDGLDVVAALDGRTGISVARDRRPDLVLLDLGLPDISGREVLAALKADPSTEAIPVVVLSGEAEADRPAELQAAGAIAYVTKPFNVRAMLDLVLGQLGRTA